MAIGNCALCPCSSSAHRGVPNGLCSLAVPSTPSTSASAPLSRHKGPRHPGPRRPCPRQPRHRRHCSSDATYLCTTRRHGDGEFPRHTCTASSCLGSIITTARSPSPLPCLCSAPARPAHPAPFTLATDHALHRSCIIVSRHDAPLPRCAPIVSSRISVASRKQKQKMRRRLRMRQRRSSRNNRSHARTGSRTAAGGAAEDGPGAAAEAAAGTAAGLRPPGPANWGAMTRGQWKNRKLRQWGKC